MRSGVGDERESAIQSGWTVEGRPTEPESGAPERIAPALSPAEIHDASVEDGGDLSEETNPAQEKPAQMSSLTVVLLGVTGGIAMLYAWVWMSWAQYYATVNTAVAAGSGSLGGILQQIVFWIVPLAPVLWFLSALIMQRHNQRRLALALVIGLIVTFPLPMVLSSGAAL
ncbi:MAG: hypothetical protein ACTIJ6_09290 [Leucobacter sp.]